MHIRVTQWQWAKGNYNNDTYGLKTLFEGKSIKGIHTKDISIDFIGTYMDCVTINVADSPKATVVISSPSSAFDIDIVPVKG